MSSHVTHQGDLSVENDTRLRISWSMFDFKVHFIELRPTVKVSFLNSEKMNLCNIVGIEYDFSINRVVFLVILFWFCLSPT